MLASIRIENFQSHVDTTIDFVDGVNVIVGLSDSGKSAILRAINWVCTNKPSGDSFVRHNSAGTAKVSLTFSDGTVVCRCKGPKDNFYQLDDEVFKAVGQGVPPQITDFLNLNEMNTMSQLDGVFLLSDSPGQIAQRINEVSSLSIIDSTLKNANADMRKCASKEAHLIDTQSQLSAAITQLEFVDDLVVDVGRGKKLTTALSALTSKLDGIGAACQSVDDNEALLGELPQPPATSEVESLFSLYNDVEQVHVNAVRLSDALRNVRSMTDRLYQLPLAPDVNDLSQLQQLLGQQNAFAKRHAALKNCIKLVNQRQVAVSYAMNEHTTYVDSLNLPDVCPMCGMMGGTYV